MNSVETRCGAWRRSSAGGGAAVLVGLALVAGLAGCGGDEIEGDDGADADSGTAFDGQLGDAGDDAADDAADDVQGDDTVPPPCTPGPEACDGVDNDCDGDTDEQLCDDGNPCTEDGCDPALVAALPGGCTATALADGPCEDGNACTEGDACAGGLCVAGSVKGCDDGNPCTADGCDAATGACTHAPAGGACDDGSACTDGDSCQDGTCAPGAAVACDDGNPCTADACEPVGGCQHTANAEPCDDGNPCTEGDACVPLAAGNPNGGQCQPGAAKACDDGDPCTADTCDAATGACSYAAQDGACDDGDACTLGDSCSSGTCSGKAKDCQDDNDCTVDSCAPEDGACAHKPKPDDTACDDGDPCTHDDACDHDTVCKGVAKACDDGNPCTADKCQKTDGKCVFEPSTGAPCDDGDACTLGDACYDGACAAGAAKACDDANPCTNDVCLVQTGDCAFSPNQAACEDGNACTGSDKCAGSKCKAGAEKACDDGNPCTTDTCDPATGACKSAPAVENLACEDGEVCTQGDHCAGGLCLPGPQVACSDGNPCTEDYCHPKTGKCAFDPGAPKPCDDGNGCTSGDACKGGTCKSGQVTCECQADADCAGSEDGDLCNGTLYCDLDSHTCKVDLKTVVVCDQSKDTTCVKWGCAPKEGQCVPKNVADNTPCEADDSVCTVFDACQAGLCQAGAAQVCNDGNPCTDDACDPKQGCVTTPNSKPCEDANPCTYDDVCASGKCAGTPLACDDGNVCTYDACDGQTGECASTPMSGPSCDDGNACSLDDTCAAGVCKPGGPMTCPTATPCLTAQCVPSLGYCVETQTATGTKCDDGLFCTAADYCKGGLCLGGAPTSCNDQNPCTADACDPVAAKCVSTPVKAGTACSDGDACTLGDTCQSGACSQGKPKVCADGQQCALPVCNSKTGECLAKPDALPCDDGNACSTGEACADGVCTPATWTLCADGNPCTNDACDTKTGKCTYTMNASPCNDGNVCTSADYCVAGACTGGKLKSCNDGSICTADACDPVAGCKHVAVAEGQACSDGNACTVGDACKGGGCKGQGLVCNDGNPCTHDACNTVKGCVYTPHSKGCSDGNPCTLGDYCTGGKCLPGSPVSCNDGNACTDDACNPKTGYCGFQPNDQNLCSDENACTDGDFCKDGACVEGPQPVDCNDDNPCTGDLCDPYNGCLSPSNDTVPCDDGNKCTTKDVCLGGKCWSGAPTSCDDGNACTVDACSPKVGCTWLQVTGPCDDGNACQGPDTCQAGKCTAALKLTCDDGNVCTADSCDAKTGCQHAPQGSGSTGKVTVVSDTATLATTELATVDAKPVPVNGKPAVATWVSPKWTANVPGATWIWLEAQVSEPDQETEVWFTREFELKEGVGKITGTLLVAADDFVQCSVNGKEALFSPTDNAGQAKQVSVTALLGPGKNALQCLVANPGIPGATAQSNPAGLLYRLDVTYVTAGAPCDDGNACTAEDACWGGTCTGLQGPQCDDGNPCTVDVCGAANGCSHELAVGTPCDDGDPCTGKDLCKNGKCAPSGTTSCDDGTPCTVDVCDQLSGCKHTVASTGEAKAQTVFSDGATTFTAPDGKQKPAVATWDQHPAWTHALEGATWLWSSELVAAPQAPTQTAFQRVFQVPATGGKVVGVLHIATDGAFACLLNGQLVGVEIGEVNYGQVLMLSLGGAVKAGTNTLQCTVLNPGQQGGTAYSNPAGLLYRLDVFAYTPAGALACEDGNACTAADWCKGYTCMAGGAVSCDDGNGCTADFCDAKSGCKHVPNDAVLCDDGNTCTVQDACSNGVCKGATPASCDDWNPCTTETCDPKLGCQHTPADGAPCDDGNACTTGDACQSGACGAPSGKVCDDGNPCTSDGCAPLTGCFHNPANGVACDDGNQCTDTDACAGGLCVGQLATSCDDGDACSADACDPVGGCAHTPLDAGVCEDGDPCTTKDACAGGKCAGGGLKACSDGEACTTDGCDGKSGKCVFTPIASGPCEDGNLCSINDACGNGKCLPGPGRDCSDANPCTIDVCDPATGDCGHLPAQGGYACSDGDGCTTGDVCTAAGCTGKAKSCDDGNPCTADGCDPATGKCVPTVLADGTACGGGFCVAGQCQ